MIALVVFVCMTAEDCLEAVYVLLLGRGRKLLAGAADGISDVMQLVTAGIGGAEVLRLGFCVLSALIVVATVAGSLAGAWLGGTVDTRLRREVKKI